VTGLSPTLRGYLWTIYAACATLALAQAPLLRGALVPPGVLGGVVVFGGLAYLAERTTLQITQAVNQTVTGAVHIAAILLFPPPLPLALTLLATLAAELPQTQRPLHKRAFNICLAGLSVGISSLAVARLRGIGLTPLRPGHVAAALPALVGVILLYYTLNSALLLGVLSLGTGRPPWRIWLTSHRPTVLPELATCAVGILGAALWRVDPTLLGLLALPLVALHAALRTAARALAAEERAARALVQASVDGLTGLLNHRAFHDRLDEEIARAARGDRPVALVMVDLDDFRAINNTHGHQAGDAALVAIAAAIRASIRTADVPGRYGGDEFAVILPDTDLDEALVVAERTCAAVAAVALAVQGNTTRPSASLGVAALPRHARTRADLIRAADGAAYAAKSAGKNHARPADDTPLVPLYHRA